MSDANGLLVQLRFLVQKFDLLTISSDMNAHLENAKSLRDTFEQLDTLLSEGGQLPRSWINGAGRSTPLMAPASCRHPAHGRGLGCTIITCTNYYKPNVKKYNDPRK